MKKIYSALFLVIAMAFGMKVKAQCTGCTTNITGLNTSNHIISSGQTMCISATGTVTGLITVSSGGTLCNQGKIGSSNVLIAGGTFKNYGTIDTYSVTVSSAGTFTNYATALIDSLWITQANTTFINIGTQTGTAFAITENASATNNGTMTVFNQGDSLATFINNGNMTVTHDCAHSYTSTCINNGNMTINNDFFSTYGTTFTNNGYMNVVRDFVNSYGANFTTMCMINVGRDWWNTYSAGIYGPALASCGGFSVTGASYNTATLGSSTTHIDICDAGHPGTGIDGAGGTIASTTTYCTCTNSCALVAVGVNELENKNSVFIETIYPNPTSNTLNIKLNNTNSETLLIEVMDMMGKTISTRTYAAYIGENELQLDVNALSQGTYILSLTDSKQLQAKRLFSITK
ncbi:MAG: hypothetical protein K0S26_1473 [Bacteroidota bacterium]|jgi:hypothetical protein|nr:hypothetical protein [Bacteroidota bacterium]